MIKFILVETTKATSRPWTAQWLSPGPVGNFSKFSKLAMASAIMTAIPSCRWCPSPSPTLFPFPFPLSSLFLHFFSILYTLEPLKAISPSPQIHPNSLKFSLFPPFSSLFSHFLAYSSIKTPPFSTNHINPHHSNPNPASSLCKIQPLQGVFWPFCYRLLASQSPSFHLHTTLHLHLPTISLYKFHRHGSLKREKASLLRSYCSNLVLFFCRVSP